MFLTAEERKSTLPTVTRAESNRFKRGLSQSIHLTPSLETYSPIGKKHLRLKITTKERK